MISDVLVSGGSHRFTYYWNFIRCSCCFIFIPRVKSISPECCHLHIPRGTISQRPSYKKHFVHIVLADLYVRRRSRQFM